MDPVQILADIRRRGVTIFRHGDRLHLRPASAVTPEIARQVTAMKARLLPLVTEQPTGAQPTELRDESAAEADPYCVLSDEIQIDDLARAVRWHADFNGHRIAREIDALDRDCAGLRDTHGTDALAYRIAVSLLFGRLTQLLDWYRESTEGLTPSVLGPWRFVVESMGTLPAGPVTFDGCSITDPGRLIALTFAALEQTTTHRNASRESIFTEDVVIETHRERLERLGIEAVVVKVA